MLELINNQFVLDPDLMVYPEFHALWDRDASDDKHEAFTYISYIFNNNNPKSPYYKNYVGSVRSDAIVADIFPEDMKDCKLYDDRELIKAEEVYRKLLSLSPLRNVLEVSKQVINEISVKLMSTRTARGQKLIELGKLNRAIEEYKKAEKAVNEDEINNVRGDRHIRERERG